MVATQYASRALCAALALLGAPPAQAACDTRAASWDRTRAPDLPSDEQLARDGAVVGRIELHVEDIFDLHDPEENNWLSRTANRLHACTRDWVVLEQLLFEPGEAYDGRLLQESERILRASGNFYDAIVRPARYAAGVVDVEVVVRDVWTLSPEISYSRTGGESESSFGISDSNVVGTGKSFELSHDSSIDRDSNLASYVDPYLLHSRVRLSTLYADNSDGDRVYFSAQRPFYALDARWAAGGELSDYVRNDRLYDLGEVVAQFRHDERFARAQYGWSRGLVAGWTRRWSLGAAYEQDEFSPAPGIAPPPLPEPEPEDRTLAYPWIAYELTQDRFWSARDQDQLDRTEDIFIGTQVRAELGWSSPDFGADRRAALFVLSGARGFGHDTRKLVLLEGSASGRLERGALRNGIFDARARYYREVGKRQRFYARLAVTATDSLDAEHQLLLGGDSGLRGYPLRYQGGDARALLTLEHRVYTDWYPLRLVRVGGAVFVDVGRTWGHGNFATPSQGWLRDLGVGLRLSPTRSTRQVVHIDLAFPLDGDDSIDDVQLLFETQASF